MRALSLRKGAPATLFPRLPASSAQLQGCSVSRVAAANPRRLKRLAVAAAAEVVPPPAAGAYSTEAAGTTMDVKELSSGFLSDGNDGAGGGGKQLAVILLNWTLPELTPQLWRRAALRVCADGGANRLYDELPRMLPGSAPEAVRAQYLPTVIKGDLDSIRPDVRSFYQQHGVAIEDLSEDQDTTDLEKCIQFVRQQTEQQGLPLQQLTLVALGALGGRLDHTLSNLSSLYSHRDLHLVLLGDGNLARLLPAGRCIIRPDRRLEGPTCGLVPCAGAAVASSRGLRWNMDRLRLEFGRVVSTSNIIDEDEVHVESDADLVWTTRLRGSSGGSGGGSGGGSSAS